MQLVFPEVIGNEKYIDIKVLELSKFSPRNFEIDVDVLLENSPNI